ncbi:hypothetical protein EJD97_017759 [Solanum chilense]|uniref:Uncharacterized protein n=1 Tax=Solanum chilense TaxID=4083 RepID=A0A6N2AG43_SOLCI|nr:hypothetical protein EJD97_017759 [Solanum chilense]
MTIKSRTTLWVDQGRVFYSYAYPIHLGQYFFIIATTNLNEFRGELNFATTATSKIYVSLKMDNIISLLHKLSKKSVDVQSIKSENASNVPIAEAMFQNWLTIAELVDSN